MNAEPGAEFGRYSAMSDSLIIIGARAGNSDANGMNPKSGAGSAYIFELSTSLGYSPSTFPSPLTLFPNPTTGVVTLDLGQHYRAVTLTVRNLLGQLVLTETYTDTEQLSFEIEGAAGIYVVEVQDISGHNATLKVIKE